MMLQIPLRKDVQRKRALKAFKDDQSKSYNNFTCKPASVLQKSGASKKDILLFLTVKGVAITPLILDL